MLELVLVSQSPRRRQILSEAGYKFQLGIVKVSENIDENLNPEDLVKSLAQTKAEAFASQHKPLELKGKIILAADTLVFLEGRAIGKPKDYIEAKDFLLALSGTTHCVITGVSVYNFDEKKWWNFCDTTEISFRNLTDKEIESYITTNEPMDKAGAYGIQGEAKKFVSEVRGSFLNVVGFPLEKFESGLDELGWKVARG